MFSSFIQQQHQEKLQQLAQYNQFILNKQLNASIQNQQQHQFQQHHNNYNSLLNQHQINFPQIHQKQLQKFPSRNGHAESTFYAHQANRQKQNQATHFQRQNFPQQPQYQFTNSSITNKQKQELEWPEKDSKLAITGEQKKIILLILITKLKYRIMQLFITGQVPDNKRTQFTIPYLTQLIFILNLTTNIYFTLKGNIFKNRNDWSILTKLPISKQNTIHIRLDDEGPFGNDEIRCFILAHMSHLKLKSIPCVFCSNDCVIYDQFPLIDGTLFTSPCVRNSKMSVPAVVSKKEQFINAICLGCMTNGNRSVICKGCDRPWKYGSALQVGTLYKYDIIAASPCCQMRVECKNCKSAIVDFKNGEGGLEYFSQYSEKRTCQNCLSNDFHFVKSVEETYVVKKQIFKKIKFVKVFCFVLCI